MAHKPDGRAKYTALTMCGEVHEHNIDIEKREIYLFGAERFIDSTDTDEDHADPGVEWVMANQFIRNIRILQSVTYEDSILIHLKTCGGSWLEGMAIYQAIKACPNYVTILNYAAARSMSSIILQAADFRSMMPHSWFMMHEGQDGYDGTAKQVRSEIAFDKHADWDGLMVRIYAEQMVSGDLHEGKTKKQLERLMRKKMNDHEEWYLTAEETVANGLADAVFDNDWSKLRYQG